MPLPSDRRLWIALALLLGLVAMHGPSYVAMQPASAPSAHAQPGAMPAGDGEHVHGAATTHGTEVSGERLSTGIPVATDHDSPAGGHGAAAHLLHLCVAVLLALAAFCLFAAYVVRISRDLLGRLPVTRRPPPIDRPPPYGAALLTRLSVSLT